MRSFILLIALCSWISSFSQQMISLEQAIQQSMQKNKSVKVAELDIDYQKQLKRSSIDIGKTSVLYMQGQYNSYAKDDNNITVTQSIPFPSVFVAQNSLARTMIQGSELKKASTENELIYQIKQVYYQLIYLSSLEDLLVRQDSIYGNFLRAAEARYRTGESRLLEKTTAEVQRNEILNTLSQTRSDVKTYQRSLATLTGNDQPVGIVETELTERRSEISFDSTNISNNPDLAYQRQQIDIATKERKVAGSHLMPDINLGYFNQTLINTPLNASGDLATKSNRFQGFQVGLSIPVWFAPQSAKIKAAKIKEEQSKLHYEYYQTVLAGQWEQAVQSYTNNKNSVEYYRSSALKNAELMIRQSELAFRNGEIDYSEYLLAIRSATQIRQSYLTSLNNLNQSIISLEFLAGVK